MALSLSKLLGSVSAGHRTDRGLSWKSHALFLASILVYITSFALFYRLKDFGMGAAAIIPVIAAGWIYGGLAGMLAGLFSLACNVALSQLMGIDWYVRIIKSGAGLEGTLGLMLIGLVVGRIGTLSGRLKKELAEKEQARGELQIIRETLERQVADRTSELTAALRQLTESNRELVARERELAESEGRLRAIVDTALDAILTVDSRGTIIGWNTSAERIYGYSAAEAIGRHVSLIIPQRLQGRDTRGLQDAVERGQGPVFFSSFAAGRRKDGTEFPTEVSQSVWESGSEVFATGIVRDITDRKRAEEALREREERLRSIVESALDAIITTDSRGAIISWNRAAEKIFGYTEAEALGRPASMLIPASMRADLESLGEVFWRTGVQTVRELTGLKKSGAEFPIEVTRALWSGGGKVFATAIARDITERRSTERERLLLSSAIEQAHENIIIMDAHGVVMYMNPAVTRVAESPEAALMGKNAFRPEVSAYESSFLETVFEQVRAGRPWNGILRHKLKSGKVLSVDQTLSPVFGPDGALTNILSVSRDVTREQTLEEQLRQSQKMEAIGTLAGGIAHDFNNILAAILGFAELSLLEAPGDSAMAERLRRILESCDRARKLVKQILTFSRKNPLEPVPVRICDSITECVRLLRASLPSTIEIRHELQDAGAVVMADPTQLHQLLLNLCTNAAQAMEDSGGTLLLGLDRIAGSGAGMPGSCEIPPGDYVRLTVRDSGAGFSREVQERMFEPFFTTKPVGRGTGMGLAVAHGIVKSYGGHICAESEPGRGASFYVLLPRIDQEPAQSARTRSRALPRGTETVLLVDDEETVAKTCGRMLETLGYRVVSTCSSTEALELFSLEPNRYGCVITDMTMPGLRGDVLAGRLLALRPDIPVILCTGYSEKISERQALEQGIRAFLLKPHTIQELAVALRSAIDSGQAQQATEACIPD